MKKMSIAAFLMSSLVLSTQAFAADFSITKEKQPSRMLVLSSAGGLSSSLFSILHGDLRDIPFESKTGKITGINYTSANYPDSFGEIVELCFYRAYNNNPVKCEPIVANSTGEVTVFNGESFKPGIQVSIVHRVEATGTFHYSTPNRIESITFNYTTN